MFHVLKTLGALLTPPGSLIVLLALGLAFLGAKKSAFLKGLGAAMAIAAVGCFILLSFEPLGALLVRPLERGVEALAPVEDLDKAAFDGYHAVVVLGAASTPLSPEEGLKTALSPVTSLRLSYGLRLARRLGLPLIISGASTEGSDRAGMVEAAARVARDFGVEDVKLTLEPKARTTWENAVELRRIMDGWGVAAPKVLVVTSAWHMKRALQSFRKLGFDATGAPTDFRTGPYAPPADDWLPSAGGMALAEIAFHEWIGALSYSMKRAPKR